MKIFATKTYEFENDQGEVVMTKPYVFDTVPNWVEKHPLYNLAIQDGTIRKTEGDKKNRSDKSVEKQEEALTKQRQEQEAEFALRIAELEKREQQLAEREKVAQSSVVPTNNESPVPNKK